MRNSARQRHGCVSVHVAVQLCLEIGHVDCLETVRQRIGVRISMNFHLVELIRLSPPHEFDGNGEPCIPSQ